MAEQELVDLDPELSFLERAPELDVDATVVGVRRQRLRLASALELLVVRVHLVHLQHTTSQTRKIESTSIDDVTLHIHVNVHVYHKVKYMQHVITSHGPRPAPA